MSVCCEKSISRSKFGDTPCLWKRSLRVMQRVNGVFGESKYFRHDNVEGYSLYSLKKIYRDVPTPYYSQLNVSISSQI